MAVFLVGAGLLLASFIVQLVLWRMSLPRSQTVALLAIFAVVPVFVVGLAAAVGHALYLSAPEWTRVTIAYIAFALAYIVLYSAIEHQSPTLAIVLRVAGGGAAGCATSDLAAVFERDETMVSRITVIEQGGFTRVDRDAIILTPRGRFFAILFERAAMVFGLGKGG